MRDIWDDGYSQSKKLTEEMVSDAEKKLGVKLQKSYIELCKIQNGGNLKYCDYPTSVPTNWANDHVNVPEIYGIGKEGILSSDYYIEEWDLPKDIVLLCGEGHWWIAFDYRNTKDTPPIIYMDIEWGEDTLIFELAPNFETFVNGLFIYEDEE
ncbi:SMI1/KNR4 family protein [Priestia megaterium]|uniref:SMI1/KNR4 family protein n=1 Tax=Priestia megaterium TaxID=1404 RepID=UPI00094DC249|nr:SMI1/KNR4 family protein [Priestia megaterium]OLO25396.1 SMI1/KNR4 family protein [Priestia megaterium]